MSIGLYTHTTRATGTTLTSTIYNGDHVNHITNQNPQMTGAYSDSVAQMQTIADPGEVGSESLAAALAGELERLRFAVKDIKAALGIAPVAQWYQTPTTFNGVMDTIQVQGANIASAGTVNLDAATGDYVHITGTTTITAITLAQGRQRTVVFDGVLTLTNGASLLLPNGVNILTAANSTFIFRGEAAGVVRCILAGGVPVSTTTKRKTADQSVTSSTVLVNDNDLTLAIGANEEWIYSISVIYGDVLDSTGLKMAVNAPAGATLRVDYGSQFGPNTVSANGSVFTTTTIAGAYTRTSVNFNAGTVVALERITVWVLNGATPGNITLQWAQGTSNGTALTAKKGGQMVGNRLA